MITRDQVADLHRGDVVEYGNASLGWTITGALWEPPDGGVLMVGNHVVRHADGNPPSLLSRTLTVVSRAPRPLYVNHPRPEPVPGDVVSRGDEDGATWSWCPLRSGVHRWRNTRSDEWLAAEDFTRLPIRLLVDGETGQVVP